MLRPTRGMSLCRWKQAAREQTGPVQGLLPPVLLAARNVVVRRKVRLQLRTAVRRNGYRHSGNRLAHGQANRLPPDVRPREHGRDQQELGRGRNAGRRGAHFRREIECPAIEALPPPTSGEADSVLDVRNGSLHAHFRCSSAAVLRAVELRKVDCEVLHRARHSSELLPAVRRLWAVHDGVRRPLPELLLRPRPGTCSEVGERSGRASAGHRRLAGCRRVRRLQIRHQRGTGSPRTQPAGRHVSRDHVHARVLRPEGAVQQGYRAGPGRRGS